MVRHRHQYATQSFITQADIVKRTVFARQVVPLATALSYGINFAMESLLSSACSWSGHTRSSCHGAGLVLLILVILTALIVGVVLATSVLNVMYRDVAFLVSTALTLLYWLVPIIYPVTFVDDGAIPHVYKVLPSEPVRLDLMALRDCLMEAVPVGLTWLGMTGPTAIVLASVG